MVTQKRLRMLKHITALAFIFAATTGAWFFLGATVDHRTHQSGVDLRNRAASVWGAPHTQLPHRLAGTAPAGSRIQVKLDLEPRQKGLLWFNTYAVDFQSASRERPAYL